MFRRSCLAPAYCTHIIDISNHSHTDDILSTFSWDEEIIFRLENGDESALDEVFPRQMHDLSFHMSGDRSSLRFDGPLYRKILQLTNGSESQSHVYFLQTYPAECFSASPGFGVLQPRGSNRIVVRLCLHACTSMIISSCFFF